MSKNSFHYTTSEIALFDSEMPFTELQKKIIDMERHEISKTNIQLELGMSYKKLNAEEDKIIEKIEKAINQLVKNGKL